MNFKKNKKPNYFGALIAIVVTFVIAYMGLPPIIQGYYILTYEKSVKATVCKMVKPEHLKRPCE